MKRIDRYLLREAVTPFAFSLLLYSVLAVVSVTLPRLPWVVGTPLGALGGWLALQFPAALVQILPIALVLAVLLVVGGLSTSNELLAMQAGAVSLGRIGAVFLALGLLCTGGALALNEWLLPATNARVGSLYWELTSGGSGLFRLASTNLSIDDFTLTFASTDRRTDAMRQVRIERWQGRQVQLIFADRGYFEERSLRLVNPRTLSLDLSALDRDAGSAEERLAGLVRVDTRPRSPDAELLLTTSASLDEIVSRYGGGGFEDPRSVSEAYRDARDASLAPAERLQARVLWHRKLAEPFANLVLLLTAVPLAILYARSRSVAFGLSLIVTLAWYLLLTLGQLLAQTGALPVWLGVWLGNLVLGLAGFALLARRIGLR